MLSVCTNLLAKTTEQEPIKQQALAAEFLLYIAEMDKVEQQWLDPLSVDSLTFEPQDHSAQEKAQNKNMTKSDITPNTKQVDEKSANKGER